MQVLSRGRRYDMNSVAPLHECPGRRPAEALRATDDVGAVPLDHEGHPHCRLLPRGFATPLERGDPGLEFRDPLVRGMTVMFQLPDELEE